MKIIVSSKYLAEKLAEIDFGSDWIESARIKDQTLIITTSKHLFEIPVEVQYIKREIDFYYGTQWQLMKRILLTTPEMPVVIEIHATGANLIFNL